MTNPNFYIYIVISLLGVAYPLLLQVVARLDEKYSSSKIVAMFGTEYEGRVFNGILYTTLILIVIWTLQLSSLISIAGQNFYINNSAAILLSLSTIILVVSFFLYVRKILIYYVPEKLIKHLIGKHEKRRDINNFKYFESLSDIFLFSIRTQQKNLSISLSSFFHFAFKAEREKNKEAKVEYPDSYYEVIHKSIEELAILKEKRNHALEYSVSAGMWLFGDSHVGKTSDKTYNWIWRNLLLIIHYKHEDMIFNHWQHAHQYFNKSLHQIYSIPDQFTHAFGDRNKKEVKIREEERWKFIEFHYALGGLLLYTKMYQSFERIFSHSQIFPPQYVLLPERMDQIFDFYYSLMSLSNINYVFISSRYPFPNLSGVFANDVIKKWISSYMALLFLRQYTIHPYLMSMKPLQYPKVPKKQGEIKNRIDGLDFFKELVEEHLRNKQLLDKVDMAFITRKWCKENSKPYPTDFIENYKAQLHDAYEHNSINLPLSADKIKQFEDSSKRIIEKTVYQYNLINNPNTIDEGADVFLIDGHSVLFNRDAFLEYPEVTHADFDSILAEVVSDKIENGIATAFLNKTSKKYLLESEDIFNAIDRLKVDEEYVIVCFGVFLEYFINQLKVKGLSSDKYKGIEIISYSGNKDIDSSFFVLKRDVLPSFATIEIDQPIKEKYVLNKISDSLELYASVIDLNKATPEILAENRHAKSDDELKKNVLLNIFLLLEVKWKRGIEMIHIMQYSAYEQKGVCGNLKEVVAIK